MQSPILKVKELKTYYYNKKNVVAAVDGVSFTLNKGEVLGIVGESGCGKTTVVRALVRLIDPMNTQITGGSVMFDGEDTTKMGIEALRMIRGKRISMIFQDPLASLNPVYTVRNQIYEVLRTHENLSKGEIDERVLELMHTVGIPSAKERMKAYPHHLSGGMQQRIMIAIALACNPEILLADEPTTALDVTVQAQILELISTLKRERSMSIILISHNMGIIAEMCDRMLVMYGGVVVEEGECRDVFATPLHPYTQGLLSAIPSIAVKKRALDTIMGIVPVFHPPITQCRFASRCKKVSEKCFVEEPPLLQLDHGRGVRCWLYENKERDG